MIHNLKSVKFQLIECANSEMTSRAFFLISVQSTNQRGEATHPAAELRAIPGVKRVEQVTGVYDFLVEVETPDRIARVSDILMSKSWLKRIHVLRPIQAENLNLDNDRSTRQAGYTEENRTRFHHLAPAHLSLCVTC